MKTKQVLGCGLIVFGTLACAENGNQAQESEGLPYARLRQVPIVAIHPEGWLQQYLVAQRNGPTGHLENAGCPFNTFGWAADKTHGNHSIEEWWSYGQNACWVDGMLRCGLLLNNDFLIGKAHRGIDYVLNYSAGNGSLDPKLAANTSEIGCWIHVITYFPRGEAMP